MPKVLITPNTLQERDDPFHQILLKAGFEIVFPKARGLLTEAQLLEELTGIDAIIAGAEPYTRRVIEAHPQVRVIARAGVGYDAVDLEAATEKSMAVTITPGTNQDAVAEHTFTLILACAKDLVQQYLGTVKGEWPRKATIPLRGRTLGIAGLGRIGKAVAVRGTAFKMKLLAYEPLPDHDFARQYGIELVSFERLLAESDFVSLHIPMTREATHLINKKTLALMKPTAFLINTARGGLVNEADLLEALQTGQIAGAGLDVYEIEPVTINPLLELKNVVATPHAAGVDLQSRADMAAAAARAVVALYKGEWPAEQVVNPMIRERFKW